MPPWAVIVPLCAMAAWMKPLPEIAAPAALGLPHELHRMGVIAAENVGPR
jgi:hypothetical protein